MSILQTELERFTNKQVLVVQEEGHAFRGRLLKIDEDYLMLDEAQESDDNGLTWHAVEISVPHEQGMPAHLTLVTGKGGASARVRLRQVILRLSNVLRVWLWTPERIEVGADFTSKRPVRRRAERAEGGEGLQEEFPSPAAPEGETPAKPVKSKDDLDQWEL